MKVLVRQSRNESSSGLRARTCFMPALWESFSRIQGSLPTDYDFAATQVKTNIEVLLSVS